MNQRNEKKTLDLANKVLEELSIKEVPVPIVSIVREYGFSVYGADLEDKISGIILVDDKKINGYGTNKLIMVNRNHSEYRNRFTIAHELGHYLLNDKPTSCFAHRDTIEQNDMEEVMANSFASYLLMPDKKLRGFIAVQKSLMGDSFDNLYLMKLISKEFLVSESAAATRLLKMEAENCG